MRQTVHYSQHDRMSNLCDGRHSRSGRLIIQIGGYLCALVSERQLRPVIEVRLVYAGASAEVSACEPYVITSWGSGRYLRGLGPPQRS